MVNNGEDHKIAGKWVQKPHITYIYIYIYMVGGIPTALKNMSSSVGMMKFPIYGNIKHVPNHQPHMDNLWLIMITVPSGNFLHSYSF